MYHVVHHLHLHYRVLRCSTITTNAWSLFKIEKMVEYRLVGVDLIKSYCQLVHEAGQNMEIIDEMETSLAVGGEEDEQHQPAELR